MIAYTTGNLLDADVDALVNTVNTVGVMGKGIALMFKEAFPENFDAYAAACKAEQVKVGSMFVTERQNLMGPRWIINFPTKEHWRNKTKRNWITDGLHDLRRVVINNNIKSIAIPPLGCGNGGLDWGVVRPMVEEALADLSDVDIQVYEPTGKYQNVAKRAGVEKLTPARALIAELVRRYWVLGIECTILEIQKLAWFLERAIEKLGLENCLNLEFRANRYGPYADKLRHLLNALDGSYLHCDRRLSDARPDDVIWFDEGRRDNVSVYLRTGDAKRYLPALESVSELIDGFESPLGMEMLATVDWLLSHESCRPELTDIKSRLTNWLGDQQAGQRKLRIFDDKLINLGLQRLTTH